MPGTLLLFEDSPTQAAQFKVHFENLGYTVLSALDGVEGGKLLQKSMADGKTPNLIILDFLLPQEDGASICRRLKANPETKSIPVLIFSGENKLRFMNEAYDAGADYYVVKGREGLRTLELLIDSILVRQLRQVRRGKPGTTNLNTPTTSLAS
jgi:DNA-binding response OmpR family regulator